MKGVPPSCAYDSERPFVFVSYAHEDAERVYPLLALLAQAHIPVWYDEGISPGSTWREELARAIDNCSVFLFLVTPESATSRHCQRECGYALDLDKPMLVVHLTETELSQGQRLSLADRQMILAYRYPQRAFEDKLQDALQRLLERGTSRMADTDQKSMSTDRIGGARHRRRVGWMFGSAAALVGVLTWSVWMMAPERAAPAVAARPVPAHPVVAVAALQNLTGDAGLDWLSEGVANLIRDALAESRHLIVASPARWQAVLREGQGGGAAVQMLESAAHAGIDYVVSGEFLATADGLLLTARMTDVQAGVDVAPYRAEGLDPQRLLTESLRIALTAKRGLGIPHTETVASFSADFAVQNMAAYEIYLSGIGYFLGFDYRAAERAFRAALELAPDFHMARYRLAHVQLASGDTAGGLATLEKIPEDAQLTARERFYVDGARALFARDTSRAKAVYRKMLEAYPYDVEARWLLALSHDMGFEDEAAIAELKRLIEQEPQNDHWWSYLGETYLRLGDYALAQQALDRYLELEPNDPYGFTILGQLELLTGEASRAATQFAHALELEPGFLRARLGLARTHVLLDDWSEAETLLREIVGEVDAAPAERIDAVFDLAGLLRAQGRFEDSVDAFRSLESVIAEEEIRESRALAERAAALAELGRFDEAQALVALAVERSPGAPTRYLFARGLIELLRGDVDDSRLTAAAIRERADSGISAEAVVAREDAARAAAYLDAMADLAAGDSAVATAALARVLSMPGYPYTLYRLGLARAQLSVNDANGAVETARIAEAERDPDDLRIDLEVDRTRALLIEAEALVVLGQRAEALERAQRFLARWRSADPNHPDYQRARSLLATEKRGGNGD